MSRTSQWGWLVAGIALGAVATAGLLSPDARLARAATSDRFEDYVMCTGAVSLGGKATVDGVWLLDYRAGKLLGTLIDRNTAKTVGWAELDLVSEFGLEPRQDVHFLMSTGNITTGQAVLYVAETTTSKFGVYSMSTRPDGLPGAIIRRHDMVRFRAAKE
jgi:hypothetical protein